jgi:hypothetical protein
LRRSLRRVAEVCRSADLEMGDERFEFGDLGVH